MSSLSFLPHIYSPLTSFSFISIALSFSSFVCGLLFLFAGSAKHGWRERREEEGRRGKGKGQGERTTSANGTLDGGAAVAPPRGAAALTAAEGRIEIERSMTVALCD